MSTADEPSLASDSGVSGGTLARGAVAGAAAWLLGYLVAYVWKAEAVAEALRGVGVVSQLLGGEAVPAWKGVTWLFLNAHFVATRVPTVAGGTRTTNFVTGEGGSVALLALPAVLLLVAGFLAARGRRGGATAGAAAGAALVVGYLPLSAAAAFATTHAIGETQATVSADPVTAILLAGAVYPVALGAVGGAAATLVE
ncbi:MULTISPECIES: transporter [Halorussus]|uniref:transporter n=1 Tax=Halorussus TaxID=1070314 RepID=UPI0013B3D7AB|nr:MULTISPECIES: transporter [Halorussus]NHN59549.1 transporter [Halorussus sp. JP-T4]